MVVPVGMVVIVAAVIVVAVIVAGVLVTARLVAARLMGARLGTARLGIGTGHGSVPPYETATARMGTWPVTRFPASGRCVSRCLR